MLAGAFRRGGGGMSPSPYPASQTGKIADILCIDDDPVVQISRNSGS